MKRVKKSKFKINGDVRNYNVENKHRTDIIWIIWDVILNETNKRGNGIEKIIESINDLFCVKYQPGCKKRRKYMIYFIISLLTEPFDTKIPLIKNEEHIKKITTKIDMIYKIIKKMKSNLLQIIYLIIA